MVDLMVVSDLHFSTEPPLCRSEEKNWFHAMLEPIQQLNDFWKENGKPTVLIPGDFFHKWKETPELINFLLETFLPKSTIYAIPGQHDLPYHDFTSINRSAFGTMLQTGRFQEFPIANPGEPICIGSYEIAFFPWDFPIQDVEWESDLTLKIGVIHHFIWNENTGYVSAKQENFYTSFILDQFDIVFFGDNHFPFMESVGNTLIVNCGSFMRRRSVEKDLEPRFYSVTGQKVKEHKLDITTDVFTNKTPSITKTLSTGIDNVLQKEIIVSDFKENLIAYLKEHKISKPIKKLILKELEANEKVH